MSDNRLTINSVEHLLAQAHAMKCESEDRLQDLADSLRQHHNLAAADIFSRTLTLIERSIKDIEQRVQAMTLPLIPPWESQWHCIEQPDSVCIDKAHYLMTPVQALDLAIYNETRLQVFFDQQSEQTIIEAIRLIAQELSADEKELIRQMQLWREALDNSEIHHEDLDPPNIPE